MDITEIFENNDTIKSTKKITHNPIRGNFLLTLWYISFILMHIRHIHIFILATYTSIFNKTLLYLTRRNEEPHGFKYSKT